MATIILQNMSDKNISDPSKGPLLDPILRKMISNQRHHKESEKINNIQLVSDLLEIFTVNNSNLNNKGCLFGSTTLPLLERIYDLSLFQLNKNIQKLEIVNSMGCNKSLSKDPSKQEGINDYLFLNQEEINYDLSLEILKHNFKGFIYNFIQVFPLTQEVSEKYPLIYELSLNCGSRNLKSARKDIVPPEQSPTFDTPEIVPDYHAQYINWLFLSGQQDPDLGND